MYVHIPKILDIPGIIPPTDYFDDLVVAYLNDDRFWLQYEGIYDM